MASGSRALDAREVERAARLCLRSVSGLRKHARRLGSAVECRGVTTRGAPAHERAQVAALCETLADSADALAVELAALSRVARRCEGVLSPAIGFRRD